MLLEIINPGETVLIDIGQENRDWGFNPAPNGTPVTLVRFGEIPYGYANSFGYEPGIYRNYCWAWVQLPDGQEINISCCHLKPVDEKDYNSRVAAARDAHGSIWRKTRLRDLPETKFIEDDLVASPRFLKRGGFPDGQARIVAVKYEYIGQTRLDGSAMPLYDISDKWPSGWTTWEDGWDEWELIERGKVWKYRHGEQIIWKDDAEQARFMTAIGEKDYVRNPKNNLYSWTKDEALQALRDGIGHGISVGGGLFGSGPHTDVITFRDTALGERIRKLTLQGFSKVSA